MAECSLAELQAQACENNFMCAAQSPSVAQALILQLLCNISAGGSDAAFNNLNGSGSPTGVEIPDYIGQFYIDTVSPYGVWFSVGLLNTNWVQMY